MLKAAIKKIIGSAHVREAKKLQPVVDEINELYEQYASLTDEQLKAKTDEFRQRLGAATSDLEEEIEKLKDEKRHTEDPTTREALQQQLGELDDQLVQLIEDTLHDLLPEAYADLVSTRSENTQVPHILGTWS